MIMTHSDCKAKAAVCNRLSAVMWQTQTSWQVLRSHKGYSLHIVFVFKYKNILLQTYIFFK